MDRRVQNNLASTQAIRKILLAIIQTPSQFCEDEDLQKSLKSQGGIAKLEYETVIDQKNVHKTSMSLNTLKRYADELFDRGFEDLRSCSDAPGSGKKAGLSIPSWIAVES